MSDESQFQVTLRGSDSSLSVSRARSGLIARGRRDASLLLHPSSPVQLDPLSETRGRAEAGNAFAQWELGNAYDKGNGVPQDFAEAAVWYRKSAEQGWGTAQQSLGRLYRDGRGVPQDFTEALHWYLKAAACESYGNDAKVELGVSYYYGIGVAQNYSEAVKWFREATSRGSEKETSYGGIAELHLGYAYASGRGVPQDFAAAVGWWLESVDGEDSRDTGTHAHYMLGNAYYKGLGVQQDSVPAYMWFALAAAHGSGAKREDAAKMRDDVAKKLTPKELAEGQRLAREWNAERYGSDSDLDFVVGS